MEAPATSAELYGPNGVAFDTAGNMYIGDSYNNRIRKVTPAGLISTVAGNGTYGYTGDGQAATSAAVAPGESLWTDPGTSISPILITMSSAR